jgi:hypothetical protein
MKQDVNGRGKLCLRMKMWDANPDGELVILSCCYKGVWCEGRGRVGTPSGGVASDVIGSQIRGGEKMGIHPSQKAVGLACGKGHVGVVQPPRSHTVPRVMASNVREGHFRRQAEATYICAGWRSFRCPSL